MKSTNFDLARRMTELYPPQRLVTKKELSERLGKSIRTIDSWIDKGILIQPITPNKKAIGWFEYDIQIWLSTFQNTTSEDC